MNNKNGLGRIAVAMGMLVASTTYAQWYAGGSGGQSRMDYNSSQLVADLAAAGITGSGSVGDTDIGGKLFVGYQFNRYFALEGGYFNMGRFATINGTFTAPAPGGTFASDLKGQGGNIDAVGLLPLGENGFSLLGRAGAAYFETKASLSSTGAVLVGYSNTTSSKTVPELGIGVQYDFTKTIAGRVEAQRYFKVGNGNTGSGDVDFYSAGIVVRF